MNSDVSTDTAKASGDRSFSDVASEVPNFDKVVADEYQIQPRAATNPCSESVGKEEQFSTVFPEKRSNFVIQLEQFCNSRRQTLALTILIN